jgi:hypothetical protein
MAPLHRSALLLALLASCGNALTTPEDVPITHLPAEEKFILTLVMETCADSCATYDEPTCDVSVDEKDKVIEVDACVGFDRGAADCRTVCGGEILAHCDIPALPAGTYTVRSGPFSHQVFLE